jgi:uncharacterized lipoprotein YddW (UPF0748 family)
MRLLPLLAFAGALAAQTPERSKPPASAATPAAPALAVPCPQDDPDCVPPAVAREFRGVWVATVRNIDWPSKPGLPPSLAKAELLALLDRAAALGLNAVIFQVRPAADALYASKIEPWSEFLTGRQGLAPAPLWDPLEFAVREAHARGLELHAWFNPYRAREPTAKSPLARSHIARAYPALVKRYGKQLWMDPGEPAVRARTLRVVLDVVKRYDVDGVHLDDYFYPYPERRSNGSTEFPDDRSWKRYRKAGGTLERDAWRRANVDRLIDTLHRAIAKAKPWVKFGISPFGIWRPGNPETVTGFDAFEKLYADSRKWLREGWVDYFTPQLYWPMEREGQRYPELLRWWVEQDSSQRHLWPGNYTSRVDERSADGWRRDEVLAQVRATREQKGATGNVHFSMKVLLEDRDSVGTALGGLLYADAALVPASPWMTSAAIGAPAVTMLQARDTAFVVLAPSGRDVVRWWLVQLRVGGRWETRLLDGALRRCTLGSLLRNPLVAPELLAVTAIDRVGTAVAPVVLRLR